MVDLVNVYVDLVIFGYVCLVLLEVVVVEGKFSLCVVCDGGGNCLGLVVLV